MIVPNAPGLETLNVSEARKQFGELLNRVHRDEELIVVEKSGIPMAGIVPMAVVPAAQEKETNRQALLDFLQRPRPGFEGVSEEEIEREIEKALIEIKQERQFARRIVPAIMRLTPDAIDSTDDQLEATVAQALKDEAQRAAKEQSIASAASCGIGWYSM
jgi:prevent-host-death family protein